MVEAKKTHKVQVTISDEDFQLAEARWKSYGFSSVAEAARVLVIGDVSSLLKEQRRMMRALEKLAEVHGELKKLKASKGRSAHVQPKPTARPEPLTAGEYQVGSAEFNQLMTQWGYDGVVKRIPEGTTGVRVWKDAATGKNKAAWLNK